MRSAGVSGRPRRRHTYDVVVEKIINSLAEGSLQPGDWLPPERALAQELQVSRATLREALKALETMGLVEVRRGEGTFIKKTSSRSLKRPLSLYLLAEKANLADVLEVRRIVEPEAAELAAERRTENDLVIIRSALVEMERSLDAEALFGEADFRFHWEVLQAAHNKVLFSIMEPISELTKEALSLVHRKLCRAPDVVDHVYHEHAAVYEAIAIGDGDRARQAMARHFALLDFQLLKSESVRLDSSTF
ncbi:MAG: FadR/GntR family transcriptional regulator [Chloroflexota bacterium]